ncbi:heterokaryon incompatibility protein-domain-containing protein [Lineolata rhizophorae]|uniref:Heterokaryon incompatibility protein-domain-containing protein n=1 Tax=Lineolata rhizophorae TaxID=578093 RepID=A0A6A6NS52_9PEZI|nr:heterokaryon incompatibility protein-domain-containing protein [Lineolata rhizophorae]
MSDIAYINNLFEAKMSAITTPPPSTKSESPYCAKCWDIDRAIGAFESCLVSKVDFRGPRHFHLGLHSQLISRAGACRTCAGIVSKVEANKGRLPKDFRAELAGDVVFSLHLLEGQPRALVLYGSAGVPAAEDMAPEERYRRYLVATSRAEVPYAGILLHSLVRVRPEELRAREMAPENIDAALVKRWIRLCDEKHQDSCHINYGIFLLPGDVQINLIDVEQGCVVTGWSVKDVQYAALSYCWGTDLSMQATKSNIEELQRPGSLLEGSKFRLPATVRDAMTLCAQLGLHYLWVDRLCITQDVFEMKRSQIEAMAWIYAKAYFTIAAVEGDGADYGLSGVGRPSADLRWKSRMLELPTRHMVAWRDLNGGLRRQSKSVYDWKRRGWTLQEHVFSKRLLVMDTQVFWACAGATWEEGFEYPGELDHSPETMSRPLKFAPGGVPSQIVCDPTTIQKLTVAKWPNLAEYGILVQEYATRHLTNQTDAIDAFAGAVAAMSQSFVAGFLYGLSEFFFDHSLLWQPGLGSSPLHPRLARGQAKAANLPSWSWISYMGKLDTQMWSLCSDYIHPQGPFPITPVPLVEWYKREAGAGARVRVDNTYHTVRTHTSTASSLPPGWTKHEGSSSTPRFFTHETLGPEKKFAYPIPPFVRPRDIHTTKTFAPHLEFRAPRRTFRIGALSHWWDPASVLSELRPGGTGYFCADWEIRDLDGAWAGTIRLQVPEGQDPPEGTLCELVAISQGATKTDVPHVEAHPVHEIPRREHLRERAVYWYFNVLWVEWEGGVAYRKALGRVWTGAWKVTDEEMIDVVLG